MKKSSLLVVALCSVIMLGSCKKKTGALSSNSGTPIYYEFHDFESLSDGRLDSTKGSSGKICGLLNDKIEYGYGLEKQFKQVPSYKNLSEINVSFNCLMDKQYPDAVFVLSVDDTVAKKNVIWEGQNITPAKLNEWSPINLTFKINNALIKPEYTVKLFIWNKGKNTFYFDDLAYSFNQKK